MNRKRKFAVIATVVFVVSVVVLYYALESKPPAAPEKQATPIVREFPYAWVPTGAGQLVNDRFFGYRVPPEEAEQWASIGGYRFVLPKSLPSGYALYELRLGLIHWEPGSPFYVYTDAVFAREGIPSGMTPSEVWRNGGAIHTHGDNITRASGCLSSRVR